MCWKKDLFKFFNEATQYGPNVFIYRGDFGRYIYKLKNFRGSEAIVYMMHDEHLGTVFIKDKNFITPNMPKLPYAVNFKIDGVSVKVNGLYHKLIPFKDKTGYYFIKRDGFNLLFYEFNNELIMKTRLLPEASENTRKLVNNHLKNELEKIRELVKDGFIPIFEVWGETLKEYDILNGGSKVKIVKEIEGIDTDPVMDLIALRYNDGCDYPFVDPKNMLKISKQYGLRTPPYFKKKVTISIGVHEFDGSENIDDLLKNVDDKLYKAKQSGRNCVMM